MLFNSIEFLLFFPIVVFIYFIIPPKVRYLWLLASSYFFYMCWNPRYILLLVGSTLITWGCGWWISKASSANGKKIAVAVCLLTNLSILFFFKYVNFFTGIVISCLGKVGIYVQNRTFDVLLPVGISFYIFQALGYTIDVYRGTVEPEKNPFRYALFVSFFPQLVAGPIERSSSLLEQMRGLETKKIWNYENVTEGLTMMLWGLFVKMVIADRIAILVDTVFDSFYLYGTVALTAGAVGFALQIYCDFMGYSTVAIGAAKVMGFTLMENFDTPYFASSVGDFWRRWHISLSTWFRDYVYIPLGGNRCSKLRKYFNIMVTFAVSGLWHGANLTYVAWGMLHGLYQIAEDIIKKPKERIYKAWQVKTESFSYKFGQVVVTFVLVDLAWIFFRAPSIGVAVQYCIRLLLRWDPWNLFNGSIYKLGLAEGEMRILLFSCLALFLVDLVRLLRKQSIEIFLKNQCLWFRWTIIFILLFSILIYGVYGVNFDSTQFIYFQF